MSSIAPFAMKSITELGLKSFEKGSELVFTFDQSELIVSASSEGFAQQRLPRENGKWDGPAGDSLWQPDNDHIPSQGNSEGRTWSEIKDKYDIDGIPFKDGYPDFSEVTVENVEIEDFTENRADNFAQADKKCAEKWTEEQKDGKNWKASEVRSYRKEEGLTWHENEDCKTLELVPTEIHGNTPHSGGVAMKKNEEKIA